jgi:hypothetical protein
LAGSSGKGQESQLVRNSARLHWPTADRTDITGPPRTTTPFHLVRTMAISGRHLLLTLHTTHYTSGNSYLTALNWQSSPFFKYRTYTQPKNRRLEFHDLPLNSGKARWWPCGAAGRRPMYSTRSMHSTLFCFRNVYSRS